MNGALLVDDDPAVAPAMVRLLEEEGFETDVASSLASARDKLRTGLPDVLLLDLLLPDGNGIELLEELGERGATEILVITGNATLDSAIAAVRSGARDYLTKPVNASKLRARLRSLRKRGVQDSSGSADIAESLLLGTSQPLRQLIERTKLCGRSDATVLIYGETGSGKELVANAIARMSRPDAPFVALNCGSIVPDLIGSELFGHERGSFTGATERHQGCFERADGGTLFLDEVTELPLGMQVNLLRVLETDSIRRVGGKREIDVDVRVIAATNREPQQAISAGKLREDLYYRLQVFPITVPALRDRLEDIELLAQHFLSELNKAEGTEKTIDADALARLRGHDWPGNVRELRNTIQHAFLLAGDSIEPAHIEEAIMPMGPIEDTLDSMRLRAGMTVAEAEMKLIFETLKAYDGNKRRAADALGVSLKTLYNKLHQYQQDDN